MTTSAWRVGRLGPGAVEAEACRRLNASLSPPGGFDPAEEAGRPQGRVWVAREGGEGGAGGNGDAGGAGGDGDEGDEGDQGVRGFLVAWRVADELEILFVASDPACRRRGVGRALLARAIEGAHVEGLARVLLEVAGRNDAARKLYEAAGFREEGVRRRYYADGDDAVMMGLALAGGAPPGAPAGEAPPA